MFEWGLPAICGSVARSGLLRLFVGLILQPAAWNTCPHYLGVLCGFSQPMPARRRHTFNLVFLRAVLILCPFMSAVVSPPLEVALRVGQGELSLTRLRNTHI